jgi:large subunit ribosomal protein L23
MTSVITSARDVILAPIVSEKAFRLIDHHTQYSFKVHKQAHKTHVRQAIEELFSVHVTDVRIVRVQPKPKRRGLQRGARPGYKKAIVTLRSGESIELFEGASR